MKKLNKKWVISNQALFTSTLTAFEQKEELYKVNTQKIINPEPPDFFHCMRVVKVNRQRMINLKPN